MNKILILFSLIFTFYLFSDESLISLNDDNKNQFDQVAKSANEELILLKESVKNKYEELSRLDLNNDKDIKNIFLEVKEIRKKIKTLEENFRNASLNELSKNDDYAFWDQGETTISQIVMEYGSLNYLYAIPQEIANLKIQLFSTIAIPRASFEELLEIIFEQNGIGVKKVNSYLRQLYIIKHDPSYIEAIISKKEDLDLISDAGLVCYILTPKYEKLKSIQNFLERFSDVKTTTIYPISTNIVIIASKQTLKRLINLYSTIFEKNEGKVIKVLTLNKISPEDAEKIIKNFFQEPTVKTRPSFYQQGSDDLSFIIQGSSLILIGEKDLINRAQKIIDDLENQFDDPSEMMVFCYSCKHSNADELSKILDQLYFSILNSRIEDTKKIISNENTNNKLETKKNNFTKITENKNSNSSSNFVVDIKTNSILMIVKKEELSKIKALLKKLDIPKKMVQIDVLLVERKIHDKSKSGMNILKFGNISTENKTFFSYNDEEKGRKGILDFIISRSFKKFPSFDLSMSFLLSQNNMKIQDAPSILAVNQTPATISVGDEISINNGATYQDSKKHQSSSYSREKFGTTIVLTPTIHPPDDDENAKGFVTIHSDISFDTSKSNRNDRPIITKRHIENEVRVSDGETIILGGLRRKMEENDSEKIPFLGDIPGFGKLFGTNSKSDTATEMFIFITPHIIDDPKEDLKKERQRLLEKRQGDSEFAKILDEAKKEEKMKIFKNSIKLLFDN
jgi:general secretion pathway protein D